MTKMIVGIIASLSVLAAAIVLCAMATAKEPLTPQGAVNVPHLLAAIAAVENTPEDSPPYRERSIYQITGDVWYAQTDLPFDEASLKDERSVLLVESIATKHIHWIRARLHHLDLEDTPHDIALVWKAGYGRCMARKQRPEDLSYAERVANVYEDTK